MAKFYNPSITQWIQRVFRFKGDENVGTESAEFIQPVIIVEPTINHIRSYTASTTQAGTTAMTTPSDRDFYLCGLHFFCQSNVTADNTDIRMTAVYDGSARRILSHLKLSLTATTINETTIFPKPIKLDRSSTIILYNAFTVGASNVSVDFYGYVMDAQASTTI